MSKLSYRIGTFVMLENSHIQIKYKSLPYLQFAGVQMKDCL